MLWEMATLASQPYQGLTNEQVLKYVIDGGVMERPEGCPIRLYIIMESCWQYQSKKRPTFTELVQNLLPDVPSQFASVSFYHSDAGVSARATLKAHYEQETQLLNDPSTPLREKLTDAYSDLLMSDPLSGNHRYTSDEIVQIDNEQPMVDRIQRSLASNLPLGNCTGAEREED